MKAKKALKRLNRVEALLAGVIGFSEGFSAVGRHCHNHQIGTSWLALSDVLRLRLS